jgi:hypothetical protein
MRAALALLLLDSTIEQAGAQNLHRFDLVLKLRLLVLLAHHETRWDVRDSYRRIGGVHALSARPGRSKNVDSKILILDLDVDLFASAARQPSPRTCECDPDFLSPARAERDARRTPAHRTYAPSPETLKITVADAAQGRFGERHHLDPPSFVFAIAGVHAEEVGGKQRRFVAAGARPDLDYAVALVEWVARTAARA